MSTVSIIMPVYNTEKFLEESIGSILKQSYQDFELIIINDNSSDNSKAHIDYIAKGDSRVKVFHFNVTKGVGYARNFGVQQATGEFVYFVDSDDYLNNDTLQLLVDGIGNHSLIAGKLVQSHLSESNENDDENEDIDSEEDLTDLIKFYEGQKKYNLIQNKSVLNKLIRKDFLQEHNMEFSEDITRYSDMELMVPALLYTDEVPYLKVSEYNKRKRNDPVSNPSVMQLGAEGRIKDFMSMYNRLKDMYSDKDLNIFLDRQLFNFYRKPVVRFFRSNHNVDCVYEDLKDAMRRVNHWSKAKKYKLAYKEMRTIKRKNIKKFKKLNLKNHRKRKIRNALKGRRRFYIQLYRAVFMKMPIKKKTVVFESFLGKSYSDSPKYIYEYMLKHKKNYNFIWVFNEKKNIPGNAKQVKRFSLAYFYHMARAKYWVSNSRLPITLNKREENVYLQTWHGTPLKQLVFDMNDVYSADPKYKSNFYKQSRRWDYLSSPNQFSTDVFRRAFKFEKEMLEFGYPRNDILYKKNTTEDILALKRKMKLPTDKKVVLYAPTWRDDEFYSRGKYKFTLQLDLEKLQRELGDEYVVVLRMHYFIASQMDISQFEGFAYDFSKYDDIAELYLVSDILITDYSSVFFDYANLKRPILFYTYDLEKYRDKLRGFYIDIETEVPGPLVRDTDQVLHAIKNIEDVKETYASRYEEFYHRFCEWDDGEASRKTVERVFKD